jgi:hypothetical protein
MKYDLSKLLDGNATHRLALASDPRIPASAIGYVSHLINDSVCRAVALDAARQLTKYVEFVDEDSSPAAG